MGLPKRLRSQSSYNRNAKRPKPYFEDEFDQVLEELLTLLRALPKTYVFLPSRHHVLTIPTADIPQALALMVLLEANKRDRKFIVDRLRETNVTIPLFVDMQNVDEFKPFFPKPIIKGVNDSAAAVQESLTAKLDELQNLGESLFGALVTLPSPSAFGKPGGWHKMQSNDRVAIACHRPASRRPILPLKVKHHAFFEFFNKMSSMPTMAELGRFRLAAMALGSTLTAPVETEATRGCHIYEVFKKLFPETDGFSWILENNLKQGKIDITCYKHTDGNEPCPWIMIEVKLEPGTHGDGQLQLCRMYDVYIRNDSHTRPSNAIRMSGAPMFLLSISGMCAIYLFQ